MQYINSTDGEWIKPDTLDDLLAVLDSIESNVRYQLVGGNSGKGMGSYIQKTYQCFSLCLTFILGVFPNDGPYDQYIDITGVTELHEIVQDDTYLLVGGSVTLTELMATLNQASARTEYSYCARLAEHLKKVANTNVRNVGTVAGNLMMKHAHNDFESDVFNLLESVGAQLSIMNTTREQSLYTPREFLDISMDKKVLYFIFFPQLDETYKFMYDYYFLFI